MLDDTPFSLTDLKRAFGTFPTGVTVMTTLDQAGQPIGMTASSFNTVSLDPALILWSIRTDSAKRAAFSANDRFTVNVLAQAQQDLCFAFAHPEKSIFAPPHWEPGKAGIPRLIGASAQLECKVWARHLAGDHEILIGEIDQLSVQSDNPLVFHAGKICQLNSEKQ